MVDGEDDADAVPLRLGHDVRHELAAGLVEQAAADLDVVQDLLEGERHGAADDQRVDFVEQVVDQLDLVGDLGAAEDGEEGPRGVLERLGEIL